MDNRNNSLDPICTDKKSNMRYWAELDALAEDFVYSLAQASIPKRNLRDETIMNVSKEVLEYAIKLLKTKRCKFPYVDEDY